MLLHTWLITKWVQNSKKVLKVANYVVPDPIQNKLVLMQVQRLAKDFLASGELDFMENKIAKIEISDLNKSWYFSQQDNKVAMITSASEADVVFKADVNALVLMASQKVDPDTLFFNRQLSITGDTELGLEIKNLIDQFDINGLDKPVITLLDLWSESLLKEKPHG